MTVICVIFLDMEYYRYVYFTTMNANYFFYCGQRTEPCMEPRCAASLGSMHGSVHCPQ